MSLPTFLGLGAMKSGTSWLHTQLEAHPEVYVPYQRKEIHYFDKFNEHGVEWYQQFFPSSEEAVCFFKEYAKEHGFMARVFTKKVKSGYLAIVCNREGACDAVFSFRSFMWSTVMR